MPRGLAAPWRNPPDRATALTRPSDQGGMTVTRWPLARSSSITTWPAEREIGLTVTQSQGGAEGGTRSLARGQRVGQARRESEHLRPGAQTETQPRNDRRAGQPAAARRGG